MAVAALALSLAWLYAGALKGLAIEWLSSADASYGLVLVAVASAVVWRRRAAFARARDAQSSAWPGLAVLLCGLCLYLTGQLGADIFLTRISFVIALAGAIWYVAGGRAVRVVAAPLAFLLMAIPLPALIVNTITLPLQLVASHIGETTLTAAGVPVFRDGNLLELPSTTLEVAQACSGLRSLISLTAIGGLLAWTERRWSRRILIVAASIPIAILMNGLRIATAGVAAETFGPKAATGFWHDFSGWVTFLVSVGVLVAVQRVTANPARGDAWRYEAARA